MSFFPSGRKARIAIGLGALPVLLALVFLTGYVVVQSSSFKNYLSRNLSSILGEHIDIGQDIQIKRIFPRLTINLPNVKILPTSLGNNIERVRVDGVTLSVSPEVLFTGGEKGRIDVHVVEATLLSAAASPPSSGTSARTSTQAGKESAKSNGNPDAASVGSSLAQTMDNVIQGTATLHTALSADRLVYIVRNSETGSVRYDVTQLSVRSRSRSLQLEAMIDVEGQPQRSVSAIFDASDRADSRDGDSFRGALSVDIFSVAQSRQSLDRGLSDDLHTFSTSVDINGNRIELAQIDYQSSVAWLRGALAVDMSTEQTRIEADLEIRKLQLSVAKPLRPQPVTASAGADRLFSYTPFSFRIPDTIVAEARIHLGAIRLDSTPVINGELHVTVSDGEVQLQTKNLTLLGGSSDLSVTFTHPEYGLASVLMKLEVDDMQLDRIRAPDSGEPVLSKGKADMIMAIRGSGPSPAHIAASSNGYLIATVDGAEINQRYSTAIDRGVVSWGLDRISVLTSRSEPEEAMTRLSDPLFVPCASVKLYLNDGRAEVSNGLIMELPENTLYSSGFINLYDEQIGFAFRARNKSLFDWSAISIARFAEVSGTLSRPTVSLNKNELAKQGILSTSSILWGPLPSLVYTLAESGVKNSRSKLCRKSID